MSVSRCVLRLLLLIFIRVGVLGTLSFILVDRSKSSKQVKRQILKASGIEFDTRRPDLYNFLDRLLIQQLSL